MITVDGAQATKSEHWRTAKYSLISSEYTVGTQYVRVYR